MKQPHTETAVDHTDDEQNTGNHLKPDSGLPGPDQLGGTRAGAENVEGDAKSGSVESTGDGRQGAGSDAPTKGLDSDGQLHERSPDRDEHGRL